MAYAHSSLPHLNTVLQLWQSVANGFMCAQRVIHASVDGNETSNAKMKRRCKKWSVAVNERRSRKSIEAHAWRQQQNKLRAMRPNITRTHTIHDNFQFELMLKFVSNRFSPFL